MSDEKKFPDWDDLPEAVCLQIEACGITQEMYDGEGLGDQARAAWLWLASWDDLTPEIQKTFIDGGVDREEFKASQAEKDSMGLCASLEPRGAETSAIVEIAKLGDELDFNRQIAEWAVQELLVDRIHVLQPILVHQHIAGGLSKPHMRCQAFFALASNPGDFTQAVIDIDMDQFNLLEPVADLKARLGLPVTGGEWQSFLTQFWATIEEGQREIAERDESSNALAGRTLVRMQRSWA